MFHNPPVVHQTSTGRRELRNKVPEVTILFWIIKILCTTVGETAADFLNVNLNLGLTGTSCVTGVLLIGALAVQFRTIRYVAPFYWLAVVLISVFGTLVTDNLTDALGVPLEASTLLFSALLLGTFALWYALERTLSIHTIVTTRREALYWLAVLFTFALGTAAGDLMAEALGLGYATTGVIVAILVALFALAWRLGLDSILAFWVVYILTRPLGASLGDYLTQSGAHGGLGLGARLTTQLFTLGIFGAVLTLTLTQRDVSPPDTVEKTAARRRRPLLVTAQVLSVAVLLTAAAAGGYVWQSDRLHLQQAAERTATAETAPLGDLSRFKALTHAMLDSVNTGDWSQANGHADEIEYAWDAAESRLRPLNVDAWTSVDDAIDGVLRQIRSIKPDPDSARSALQALDAKIANP
jgi:uncharacterized membrane-anchored protein